MGSKLVRACKTIAISPAAHARTCEPKYATRPRTSSSTRSKSAKVAAVGEWMVAHTVVPSRARPRTTRMTSFEVYESSPEVGSSRNRTLHGHGCA